MVCKRIYIGETKNILETRLKQQLYYIKRSNKTSVLYTHFKVHSIDHLRIMGLETNSMWSIGQRRAAERRWIRVLDTIDLKGLNEKYN